MIVHIYYHIKIEFIFTNHFIKESIKLVFHENNNNFGKNCYLTISTIDQTRSK
jgi:hypothetical protein